MAESPEDWPPPGAPLPLPAPPGSLQAAVEAFLRSPLPGEEPAGKPAEPWAPEVTDAEEPTVLDVVLESDPELDYVRGAPGGAYVDFDLNDGSLAVSWAVGDLSPDELFLPEAIAETLHHGDRVRLAGRWAHVRLVPNDGPDDDWVFQSTRMFVVEGYEQLRA